MSGDLSFPAFSGIKIKIEAKEILAKNPSDRKLSQMIGEMHLLEGKESLSHPQALRDYSIYEYKADVSVRKQTIEEKEGNKAGLINHFSHVVQRIKNLVVSRCFKTDKQLLEKALAQLVQSEGVLLTQAQTPVTHDSQQRAFEQAKRGILESRAHQAVKKTGRKETNSEKKLEHLRRKNLEASKAERRAAKVAVKSEHFTSQRKDVHGNRVFLAKKVKKGEGEGIKKKGPSNYYIKTNNEIFQFIVAPFYSLFVRGSPEVLRVKENGNDHYATKEVPGGRVVKTADLKKGFIPGMARSALMALLLNYSDRRPGNALLDNNNRFVLIDYEFGQPDRRKLAEFKDNPIGILRGFIQDCDQEQLDAIGQTPAFQQEFAEVFLLLTTFPYEFMVPVLESRIPNQGQRFVDDFQERLEEIKRYFPGISNPYPGKSHEEIAEILIQQMSDSRILREIPYEELKQRLISNLGG